MTQLAGKVVWITGASSGIGEALAIEASRRGAKLVLTARRDNELQRVRGLCADPKLAAVLPLDLLKLGDAAAAVKKAESFFGPVDVLVNNAGRSQRSLVMDTTLATYRELFELDFFSTVELTKALLPGMVARKGGHLVVISSVVGYISSPLRSGYAAAKHALHGFYEALAAELWRENVKVTMVCPGYIRTQVSVNAYTGTGGSHGKMDQALDKGMPPERCAARVWNGVERDRAEVLVGKEKIAVYIKRFLPGLWAMLVKRVKPT
ncbi:MAG TPA: SDR family oxidoreductase [Candidatus Binatia bacterium]|nr:SDR family oxidoreductase [Candidatus Binatia bacterium]